MKFLESNSQDETEWLPISDLMSVLMMVFLLIAISYMLKVNDEKEKMKEVVIAYNELKNDLYRDLYQEFKYDLKEWDAEIDKDTLTVRFNSPEILFEIGSDKLKSKFKNILKNFFPRYIALLRKEKYIKDIEEIRIEGHTSSIWRQGTTERNAYIQNMELSQGRTRKVLQFILNNEKNEKLFSWITQYVTANGLSSSKLILENGQENRAKSRRVEFRAKTKTEERIVKILEQ